jgi:hypothetical protein
VAKGTRVSAQEHDRHDLELIARAAAGDAAAIDAARAAALVASCVDCLRLDLDLRAIAVASRTLAASPRPVVAPRDFRLSADDAAQLRRRGPFGWLAGTWRRSEVAWTRLGRGLVAVGVAGLLLATVVQGGLLTSMGSGESGATNASKDRATLVPALGAAAPSAYAAMAPEATEVPAQPDQAPSPAATGPAPGPAPVLLVASGAAIGFGAVLLVARGWRSRKGP